jgi:hypothetical protein
MIISELRVSCMKYVVNIYKSRIIVSTVQSDVPWLTPYAWYHSLPPHRYGRSASVCDDTDFVISTLVPELYSPECT